MRVRFDSLPVAAMLAAEHRVVAVNANFEKLTGVGASELVGLSADAVIQRFVPASDLPLIHRAVQGVRDGQAPVGDLWCRIIDRAGRARAVRIIWEPRGSDDAAAVYLLEADESDQTRAAAESLARAGGDLVSCRDEAHVLEAAVEALAAQGWTATALLIEPGSPQLAYGPSRTSAPAVDERLPSAQTPTALVRPNREILSRFNPRFHERRAAYFQNGALLVQDAYPADVAAWLERLLPGQRMVQAPLFVDNQPYGAIVVTSDSLTAALAGAIEMFAELVARAIESVRAQASALARLRELEQLQNALVQRERLAALGEAAAVMAHEVRNPISTILNAATLLRRAPEPAESARLLDALSEEAERLERVVRHLLDLGRPLTPNRRVVDPSACIEQCLRVVNQRGLTPVRFERPASAVAVRIDPDLLELALVNVLTNAAQASRPGQAVEVSLECSNQQCVIRVDDRGPGFGGVVAERLFEPFFTTRAMGTGIGLAVVRRAVEANLGTVALGESPSGGGRVALSFPLAAPAEL